MTFRVKFWGVRGNIAVSHPSHSITGGNTSCIEINLGKRRVVFNAGTGMRELGREMMAQEVNDFDLMFTHTSWDHIAGFPFFVPAYVPGRSIRVFAGHLADHGGVRRILSDQMRGPTFPIPIETMQADLKFEDFKPGDEFSLFDGAHIRTTALDHPIGATGYRLDYEGRSFALIAPTEHGVAETDRRIVDLIDGADLVAYDCTYGLTEYSEHRGMGHSTWAAGVEFCRAAKVKRMAMYHHSPDHDDKMIERLEADAKAEWPGVFAARDYMEIDLTV